MSDVVWPRCRGAEVPKCRSAEVQKCRSAEVPETLEGRKR
ncbi:acetate permease [Burkholderia pseudomallei]|nr:acetate permease [Burkholderia pseudomallei]PNX23566.1 acetate permease [Burkholderia pseudomallei]